MKLQKLLTGALVIVAGLFLVLLVVDTNHSGDTRAMGIARMAASLFVVWVCICGTLMYLFRNRVRTFVQKVPLPWQLKFVVFATVLALLEEAITTTLTNLAPLFGSKIGEAYITASTNYIDVVTMHSVVVFAPLFIAWSILLTRYAFSAFSTFFLFGIMGVFCEATFIGPAAFLGFPMWVLIYGLMVFLPAYAIPENRGAKQVYFGHYVFAVPAAFAIVLPMLIPIVWYITQVLHHPSMHF